MLPPTQLCQYKFQCHPRQRGSSWMRVEQRHSSKSWQRAYEQRWLRLQRSRGKKYESVVMLLVKILKKKKEKKQARKWKQINKQTKKNMHTLKSWFVWFSGIFMLGFGYKFRIWVNVWFVSGMMALKFEVPGYEFVFEWNVCPDHLSVRFVLKFVSVFTLMVVQVTFTLHSFIFVSDSCWSSNSCLRWAYACLVIIR